MTKQKITEPMPRLWWLSPWTCAIEQRELMEKHFAVSLMMKSGWEQYEDKVFQIAKRVGYDPAKTPHQPIDWLGGAVVYWKAEAENARKERDKAIDTATVLNTKQPAKRKRKTK